MKHGWALLLPPADFCARIYVPCIFVVRRIQQLFVTTRVPDGAPLDLGMRRGSKRKDSVRGSGIVVHAAVHDEVGNNVTSRFSSRKGAWHRSLGPSKLVHN